MPRHSSLARLLQCSVLAQLAILCGWLAWRWPVAPGQAIGVAALVLLAGPIVLGLEFITLAIVDRAAGVVQRPTAMQLVSAWVAESLHLFRTFWWRQPFRWRAEPDYLAPECAGRTGVVLVHGFMCNRGFWNRWMRALRERGHGYAAVNLEPVFGSIDAYAAAIDEAVVRVGAATGRPPVVVCHSMGGLAARAWWRDHGAAREVAALITIATPHSGTWMGRFSSRPNGKQMRLRSGWLRELAQHEKRQPLPHTTCWYSNCDNIVFPTTTAMLGGADNRFVPAQPHVALAFHPEVLAGCLGLVARADARRQGECVTGPAPENG